MNQYYGIIMGWWGGEEIFSGGILVFLVVLAMYVYYLGLFSTKIRFWLNQVLYFHSLQILLHIFALCKQGYLLWVSSIAIPKMLTSSDATLCIAIYCKWHILDVYLAKHKKSGSAWPKVILDFCWLGYKDWTWGTSTLGCNDPQAHHPDTLTP